MQLTIQPRVDGDKLLIAYRLANTTAKPLYVINGGFKTAPGGAFVWTDRLRVDHQAPDVAVLTSALKPRKPGVGRVKPPTTFSTKVEPGKIFEAVLSAPQPLIPENLAPAPPPLVPAKVSIDPEPVAAPTVRIVCKRVIFRLGVVPHEDVLEPFAMELGGKPVVRLNELAWKKQTILAAEQSFEVAMMIAPKVEGPPKS